MCHDRVDKNLLTADSATLCLDGVSCTKKSSTLRKTGRRVDKVTQNFSFKNTDSYGPSMLGYICSGMMQLLNHREPRFHDRSILNVMEWHLLWKFMDIFMKKFGNCRPIFTEPPKVSVDNYDGNDETLDRDDDIVNMVDFTRKFDYFFTQLKNSNSYKHFRDQINVVAFVDSDQQRCDRLHKTRAEGSDVQRAEWKYYTILQNRMYVVLYPNTHVDLAWFSLDDDDVVTSALSVFLNELLDYLMERRCRADATTTVYETATKRNAAYGIPMRATPPVVKRDRDLYLMNTSTHVYRTLGRLGCRRALVESDQLPLSDYQIPKCISIYQDGRRLQTAEFLDPTREPEEAAATTRMERDSDDAERDDTQDTAIDMYCFDFECEEHV